ncbi:hypothetical protein Slin15195_G074490 [Septoria linicola]|uniref:Uncharacterized protein n=1 Tax=Septoria linicola TaxID=215465 RepID=A0A9Q9AX67_9PEZI|nr:hypothetical protein Slin14017_G035610 [Septoria linicola]USW54130.1 hypothetical protein Slin15195_G074490 [Septoria linicola]
MAPRKSGRLSTRHWEDTVEAFKKMPRTSADDMMSKATDPTGQGKDKPPCGYRCLLANVSASTATLPTCTDKCEACFSSFRSEDVQRYAMHGYHAALTDERVATKTEYMVEATKNNSQYLRRRLQLYGDTVQKRWSKYPKTKRSAILLKAMPTLYDQRFATTMLMRDIMSDPTQRCSNSARWGRSGKTASCR